MYNHNEIIFQFGKKKQVVVTYATNTRLPIIKSYKDTTNLSVRFAFGNWTTDEQNNNLAYLHKHVFKWNFLIVHLGFQYLQWISRKGGLGNFVTKFDKTTVIPPKCDYCMYGKQDRTLNKGASICKDKKR